MRFKGFIGGSYKSQSVEIDGQRAINLFPQIVESQNGKDGEVAALLGVPGFLLLNTIGTGPIRGAFFTTKGLLYVVSGNKLYSVSSSWIGTLIGTLQTTTGPVGMADDGFYLVVVDGPNGYYVDFTIPGTLTQIVDANWLGSNTVTYQDGYFIFTAPNSAEFYLSDLNAITFNAPANTAKNGYPDNIVSFISVNRNLWLFGDVTTEVWFDAGDNLNPFQYIQGSLTQFGCVSTFSVVEMANTVIWLAKDKNGKGMVVMANGYIPVRISTHAVEYAIQAYSTISDAIAFAYQQDGHQFYVITFPTANATWVYDISTSLWHERASLVNGALQRIRANCYANAYSTHVVGDYANGNIYAIDPKTYSDNGNPLPRIRICPQISNNMNQMFFSRLQLDILSGVGLDGIQQGTDPQAIMQFSDDGGHNWSDEQMTSFGKIGMTKRRAEWRRLGHSRDRVFKITITDPVKVIMVGAELDVESGES